MYKNFWYLSLAKSPLTPPSEVFIIVWPILYTMMVISLFFYLRQGFSRDKILPIVIFTVQLLLNFAWSPVFFIHQDPLLALVILCLLIVFVICTIILFHKNSKAAAWLLVPYAIWLFFAFYLNFEIVRLNY